jgi:Sigma-54 interaction domain
MTEERICRVLIVDNELEYAAQTASKLREIRPSLLNHNQLQIQLTNNAYFVAERLRLSPVGQPPWDIIISDVYMPFPNQSLAETVPEIELKLGEFSHDDSIWDCWQSVYSEGALASERVDHGGLRIAYTIAERLDAGESMSDLKLILMSECLEGDERDTLLAYQASKTGWLKYYDKTEWDWRNRSTWPTDKLAPDIFQWALFMAIAQRDWKYWGDSIYEIIPDAHTVVNSTTPQMESIRTEARRLGRNADIETVLITGEKGTGREVVARLIHEVRLKTLQVEGPFVVIDCSSIPADDFESKLLDRAEESDGGTLFVDEVDKLTIYHQGLLYHLIKDRRISAGERIQPLDFNARLTVCTASGRNLEELNRQGDFHSDLYFLLKDEQLHIAPLRERRADAISLAKMLTGGNITGLTLSEDAKDWIKGYDWPGNTEELMRVIKAAGRRALTGSLTGSDLQRVVTTQQLPPLPTGVFYDDKVEENGEKPVAATAHQYAFRKTGDYWQITYEGRTFLLRDAKGLHYIAHLIRHHGTQFTAFQLTVIVNPVAPEVSGRPDLDFDEYEVNSDLGRADFNLDAKALKQYQAELKRLYDDRELAKQRNDSARIKEVEEDIHAIRKELGLGGRGRKLIDTAERARRAVFGSYDRALNKILEYDRNLYQHLHNSITTGQYLVYDPEKVLDWEF